MSAIESVAGSFAGNSAYGLSHNHNIKAIQDNQLQKKQDLKLRTNDDAVDQANKKAEVANTRDKKDMRLRHINSQTIKADSDHKVFDNPAYAQKAATGPMPGKPLFSANNMLTLLQFRDDKSVKIQTDQDIRDNKRIAVGVEQDKLLGKKDVKIEQNEFVANKKLYEDTAGPKPEDLKPGIDTPGIVIAKNKSNENSALNAGAQPEDTNKLKIAREELKKLQGSQEKEDQFGSYVSGKKVKWAELTNEDKQGIYLSKTLNSIADRAKQNQSINLSVEQNSQFQSGLNADQDIDKLEQSLQDRSGKEFSSDGISL